ncbi:putative RNA-dependent RNA polymerase [Rhizoctonia solani ourmia-like virus 2]|uniref:RNA-dependent RNA polymerase n=1 Tax=Rhizoctonia solani ourmia-like virus 2 TaxID=2599428 RepID=A0ABX5Y580_9VIRU|nr:putative RNA-dependent RNA polymerase [Rhizoctonia solani ourmia-like virus 2]QDW65427.1 putative RNA-dependent RNA polymerase [Rhizoctonia solani ourmia-like virus 2]
MFVRRRQKLRDAWARWRDECTNPASTAVVVAAGARDGPTESTVASMGFVPVVREGLPTSAEIGGGDDGNDGDIRREPQVTQPESVPLNLDGISVRRVAPAVVLSFLDSAFPPPSKGNDVFDTPLEVDDGPPSYSPPPSPPPPPDGQFWAASAVDIPAPEIPAPRITCAVPVEVIENILEFVDDDTLRVIARFSRGFLAWVLRRRPGILGSASFDRMLLRLALRSSPAPLVEEPNDGAVRLESILHSRPFSLKDPLRPNKFRRVCSDIAELRESSARTGQDTSAAIGEKLDIAFGIYLRAIGLGNGRPFHFDKKVADVALRGAIGSVGSHGDHIFRYPGLRDLDMRNDKDAARAFGIYMARKTFFNPSPDEMESATRDFLSRVCQPPPPSPRPERTSVMLAALRRFTRLHLVPPHTYVPPVPCSGKSCLERSRKLGGKRAALFHGDEPTTGYVRPQTIFSGGKPRTICLHSYLAEECAFFNSLILDRIRNANWLVTGRTVAQWVSQNQDRWTAASEWAEEPYEFASGDLRAATDMFSGEFARAVLEILYPHTRKWHGLSLEYILSNITDALFEIPPPPGDAEAEPTYAPQKRGQLLSSDASFPILCLIGVLIAMETLDVLDDLMSMDDDEFVTGFLGFDAAGVNGDDIVIYGPAGTAERWALTVPLTGGVPEPTKSPCDPEFFTINSQLWRRPPTGRAYEIETIKPAMLVALSSSGAKAPHESWVSLLSSPLLTDDAVELLGIDTLLFPELPVVWGGLGYCDLASRIPDELLLRRALFCRESRGLTWIDATLDDVNRIQAPYFRPGPSQSSFGLSLSRPVETRQVSGLLPLSTVRAVRQAQFSDPGIVHWTSLGGQKSSLNEIVFRVRSHLIADKERLLRRVRAEYDYYSEIERDRLVYVEDFELPASFCDPTPHPPPPSSLMRHRVRDFDPGDRTQVACLLLYEAARTHGPHYGSKQRQSNYYRRWASAHEKEMKKTADTRGYSLRSRAALWSGSHLSGV